MTILYSVPSQPGFFVLARTIRVPSAYFVCSTLYAELELCTGTGYPVTGTGTCLQLCMQENPVFGVHQWGIWRTGSRVVRELFANKVRLRSLSDILVNMFANS